MLRERKDIRVFVLFVITNDNPYCLISALFIFDFPCFFVFCFFSGRFAIIDNGSVPISSQQGSIMLSVDKKQLTN